VKKDRILGEKAPIFGPFQLLQAEKQALLIIQFLLFWKKEKKRGKGREKKRGQVRGGGTCYVDWGTGPNKAAAAGETGTVLPFFRGKEDDTVALRCLGDLALLKGSDKEGGVSPQ